jgi:glycosyltransferase involved in cell wall biosynthesis
MAKGSRRMNASDSSTKFGQCILPVISVAMPVYNGERYLAAAIDSILSQTCNDFELIIIDDGSTDNSAQVLREYQKQDSRIRLIVRENRNLATTLNEIIDLARGKWIARMDQDDIALPHRFERQLQWLDQTGADICGSWVRLFGSSTNHILKHPQTDAAIKMEILFSTPFAHPTVMMKTELVKKLHYDKTWEKCEDYDLWERAARAGWKMTNVPEILLLYRQHSSQISSSAFAYQQLLTQKIRRRYWGFIADSVKLEYKWIDEVLKLRESSLPKSNMDDVDSALIELLQRNVGEARATIFDHATRLYFRAAVNCPNVATRWGRLNKIFGYDFALTTKIKLWLLSKLRVRPGSIFFEMMKKLNAS